MIVGKYLGQQFNLWAGLSNAVGVPSVVVSLRLAYWSLPFSMSVGGHCITRPGLTFGIGPIYVSWCKL